MAEIPRTMRAWIVARNAEPATALELKTDYPVPAVTGANILVKISYAALNPADIHFILNLPVWLPFRRRPIPGMDFAGTVVAAGPNVSANLGVGTKVAASLTAGQIAWGKGSMAEYVLVPADSVAVTPPSLNDAAAAGLMGVAGQTANLMRKDAQLKKGDRVLINGASGGVGTLIVQIAKASGASITAICSGANADLARRLGADEVLDYKVHDPIEAFCAEKYAGEPFDHIFDTAGRQALYWQSPKYLKPQGKFISIVGGRTQGIVPFIRNKMIPVFLGGTPRTFSLLGLAPSGAQANEVAQMVKDGLIKECLIDSEFAFEDAPKACERVQTKRAKGKVVIKVHA